MNRPQIHPRNCRCAACSPAPSASDARLIAAFVAASTLIIVALALAVQASALWSPL
ncbi:hypothetical protein ACLIMP_04335 [Novosphingobium aerophilum]|uniref:hypothetical protein n=1 Tax=Novosphingobium aerophilum TaxID=2839843 RepID=UPI00163D71B9|nr:hypothetical protein [uncultured Novosphingobium sp.]